MMSRQKETAEEQPSFASAVDRRWMRATRLLWTAFAPLALQTAVAVLATPREVSAQDDPDGQAWVQVLALGEIGDRWRSHIEVQPRFMNNVSELGLTLVRTAVGRQIAPRATVWLGHAWVPRTLGEGTRHEQRAWQQLLTALPAVKGWMPSVRLRVEQRWLAPWDGVSHRVRVLARAQRPVGAARRWGVFAYDEAMVTLDHTPRGPSRGYDRNRLSAGVARRFTPALSTDVGYIWENSVIADGRRNDHVFIAVLNISAPR